MVTSTLLSQRLLVGYHAEQLPASREVNHRHKRTAAAVRHATLAIMLLPWSDACMTVPCMATAPCLASDAAHTDTVSG